MGSRNQHPHSSIYRYSLKSHHPLNNLFARCSKLYFLPSSNVTRVQYSIKLSWNNIFPLQERKRSSTVIQCRNLNKLPGSERCIESFDPSSFYFVTPIKLAAPSFFPARRDRFKAAFTGILATSTPIPLSPRLLFPYQAARNQRSRLFFISGESLEATQTRNGINSRFTDLLATSTPAPSMLRTFTRNFISVSPFSPTPRRREASAGTGRADETGTDLSQKCIDRNLIKAGGKRIEKVGKDEPHVLPGWSRTLTIGRMVRGRHSYLGTRFDGGASLLYVRGSSIG